MLLTLVFALALFAFVLSMSDLPRVLGRLRRLQASAILGAVALAWAYWALKAVQLKWLLGRLGIGLSWRSLLRAYAVGELGVTLPTGVYMQNYVLRRQHGEDFARSAAATTASTLSETALVALLLFWLKIPGWQWMRPALAGLTLLSLLLGAAVFHGYPRIASLWRGRDGSFLARLAQGFARMSEALRALSSPVVVVSTLPLSSAYLAALVGAFRLLAHGVGLAGVTFAQAATIYGVSLGAALLLGGVLSQWGLVEAVGSLAAQAWGYSFTQGLSMVLAFRLVWTGAIWLISAPFAFGAWRRIAD
ncbi:MAG: lysylphosphatidylglycerol synthase domain-containing protein [Betaproteobacteria bacterium]|nr:lysylphosphatidylglycerol synthase domain-containing protein [Betaproteobacteria bacterium]